MGLVSEIDNLLHRAEVEEYTDDPVDWGIIGALKEVRALALEYVGERWRLEAEHSALNHTLLEENSALRKQQDESRQELARAVGLVVPGHRTLPELVAEVIEAKDQAYYELEHHECESECENCRWGYNDDCDECDNTAATVKRAIEILEELT